jgi:phage terminase small subunit
MIEKLTAKQARFVEEYLVDLNATQAAIRSGYSVKTAKQIGTENLAKLSIVAEIKRRQADLSARTQITQEMVLAELGKLGFSNILDYVTIQEDGDPKPDLSSMTRDQAAALSELIVETYAEGCGDEAEQVKRVKFKLADKRAALVDIGRHLGMFKNTLVVNVPVTFNIIKPEGPKRIRSGD